ncbi:hypothetical protein RHGRI_023522 [Rhododendron griersonianum]|uniref:Uncharacterized protein n=1 Tax=Rhododendron griersonianum TaxID=479676 RepID=A0AAV6J655_9ERIC|nr:hypothetical protein RHGRI_023522 [Rhododendron griersonianum]
MDFGSHFPALRPTLLIHNPSLSGLNRSMNVLNKVVPLVRGNIIDHLEQITVENNDHLVVEESDGPSTRQIEVLKAEVQSLRMELDSQSGKDKGPAVTDVNAQPLWTEVVTQQRISPRMKLILLPSSSNQRGQGCVDVGVELPDTVDVEYANGCQAQCSAVMKVPKQEWVVKSVVEHKGVVSDGVGSPSVNVQEKGVQEWVVKAALEQNGMVPDASEVPLTSGEVSPTTLTPNKASSSQGFVVRSSNSFSALALDDEVEQGNGALVMDEEVTTVTVAPSPIVDTMVPPAKNTRGRGKGKGGTLIPSKGGGGGLKP